MSLAKKLSISLVTLGLLILSMLGLRSIVGVELYTSIFGFLGGWQLGSWAYALMVKIWPGIDK